MIAEPYDTLVVWVAAVFDATRARNGVHVAGVAGADWRGFSSGALRRPAIFGTRTLAARGASPGRRGVG
jgi:hypothetical protein